MSWAIAAIIIFGFAWVWLGEGCYYWRWRAAYSQLWVVILVWPLHWVIAGLDDWSIASNARQAQQAAADRVPRVIREFDGCKVYAFKDSGRWHYTTKCPSTASTSSSYEVVTGSGKSRRTHIETEVITTGNQ